MIGAELGKSIGFWSLPNLSVKHVSVANSHVVFGQIAYVFEN